MKAKPSWKADQLISYTIVWGFNGGLGGAVTIPGKVVGVRDGAVTLRLENANGMLVGLTVAEGDPHLKARAG